MDDYLAKPFTPDQLQQVINRWLPRKGGDAPALVAQDFPAAPPTRVFDADAMLRNFAGNIGMASKVAPAALDNMLENVEALEASLAANDVATSCRIAHTVKGVAANFGGEATRGLAFEIEQLAGAGSLDQARLRLGDLTAALNALRAAVQAWLEQHPADQPT